MEFADGLILADIADGIGVITINNPAKLNAISMAMWTGMGEALDLFEADPAVRVAVMMGAGDKAFVSGIDLSQAGPERSEPDHLNNQGRGKLAEFSKPLIAGIRGYCLGAGLAIAMQADLRIAAESAQIGTPTARMGDAYPPAMMEKLLPLIGPANIAMMLFTGTRFSGAEAARIGLVNRVVPDADLAAIVMELARTIAGNAPLSIAAAKLSLREMGKRPELRDMAAVERAATLCQESADFREGRAAFREKRPPNFQGN